MHVSDVFLEKVNKRCIFKLDNEPFSQEMLAQAFIKFVSDTSLMDVHNVSFAFHTGSPIFDAIAVIFAAISNLVLNTSDSDDIVLSLEKGDFVVYGEKKKARYVFAGLENHPDYPGIDYAILKQGKDTTWVPRKKWRYIEPYNGESRFTSSIGIRKTSGLRSVFFKTVLDYKDIDIPSVIDTSTVIVMPRDRADRIVRGLTIQFGNVEIPLLDLVTASFFTENNELNYGGNIAKADPILKFTGKISVAGQLIRGKDGNKTTGMIVMGNDIINRSYTELPEYFDRRSLKYLIICGQIDYADSVSLINSYEDGHLFVCTKDFLLSNSAKIIISNNLTRELSGQVDAIIEHRISQRTIASGYSWGQYREFKKALLIIRNADLSESEKNDFIIGACSLMKLFLTAIFPLNHLEKMISAGELDIVSPSVRLENVRSLAKRFPHYLKEKADLIVDVLDTSYLTLSDSSQKETVLRELLADNAGKKIAVIVPKAYYSSILHNIGLLNSTESASNVSVTTANRFDNSILYDLIIPVGYFPGSRFDVFSTKSAKEVIILLYDFESNLFKHRLKNAEKAEKQLDRRSSFQYVIESEYEDVLYDEDAKAEEIDEVERATKDLDQFVDQINAVIWTQSVGYYGGGSTSMSEVIAAAIFESGETALFTKMYKAYVFDDAAGEVKEVGVEDLAVGDSLVFKRYDSDTKDIVDDLLTRLLSDGRLDDDVKLAYLMSKRWKEALVDYLHANKLSPGEVSARMKQNGITVSEITIRTWLDENAHIVGPREIESIKQIGILVGDGDLIKNAEAYHTACKTIRRVRLMILKEIGKAIIAKLEGKKPEQATIMSDIFDRIDSLARILRIESIAPIKQAVPFNLTNRPIEVKE